MEIKLIREVFPNAASVHPYYFFTSIISYLNLPTTQYSAQSLAADYFLGHSGSKICSPLLIKILGDSDVATDATTEQIFTILRSRFGENWKRLLATVTSDYNPIHNYNMNETIHRDLQGENKSTNTGELTSTTKQDSTMNGDEFIYGFNSENEQPSNKRAVTSNATTTDTQNGTSTDNGTNHDVESITKARSGNIGVTTTQQMLEQERELWKWNFIEQLYKDIDSVLTLKVYDACRV